MMHQIITSAENVAEEINKIVDGDIYQIIPFKSYDTDLFLILWEDRYYTTSIACGQPEERVCV